jgi:hypothetical protein
MRHLSILAQQDRRTNTYQTRKLLQPDSYTGNMALSPKVQAVNYANRNATGDLL